MPGREEVSCTQSFKLAGSSTGWRPATLSRVAKLPFDVGSALEFSHVLAVFKDGEMLTESQLGAAKVIATITANDRAKKITVFKFKRKKAI